MHIVELAEAIDHQVDTQVVIAPDTPGCYEFDSGFRVRVIRLKTLRILDLLRVRSPWLLLPFYSLSAARSIRSMKKSGHKIDLIHTHGPILGGFMMLWNRLFGFKVPLLVMEHGYGGDRGPAFRASRALSRWTLLRLFPPNYVLILNDGTRIDLIQRDLEKMAIPYTIVFHGIDSEFFAPPSYERDSDDFVVLFPHRDIPVKRLDLAIESFATFQRECSCSGRLALLCSETPEMRKAIDERGLRGRVLFEGTQTRDCVREHIWQCDVVIGTSLESNMNRAIQEAMSCGKPVVVFDSGGTSELIRDKENGLLVHPGDTEAMARALELLLKQPSLRLELGERARRTILNERSWMTRVRTESDVYRMLCGKSIRSSIPTK